MSEKSLSHHSESEPEPDPTPEHHEESNTNAFRTTLIELQEKNDQLYAKCQDLTKELDHSKSEE